MEYRNERPIRRIRKKPTATSFGLSYKVRNVIRAVFGIVLLVVFGLLCWWGHWWFTTGSWNALRSKVNEYIDRSNGNPMAPVSPIKKLVVVDVRARDLDPLHYDLPRGLRATRPEEVTTIARIRRDSTLVGHYSNGGIATRSSFEVEIIDNASKRTLETRVFKGDAPPHSFLGRARDSASGDMPIRDVSDYLAGLPGRTFSP